MPLGQVKDVTPEIQGYCDQVKDQAEALAETNYLLFQGIRYRPDHEGAGTTYYVKVLVGKDYDHLRIWKKPVGTLQLVAIRTHKTEDSPLEPFN